MPDFLKVGIQTLVYGSVACLIGFLSASPAYVHLEPEMAVLKMSFMHAANRVGECRRFSQAELDELAPNMRQPLDCPRERLPLILEIELDGETLYRGAHPPGGLWGDGPAAVYERFPVAAGLHELTARMRDSNRDDGFDYERSEAVNLAPHQNFVIDFRSESGGFVFQ